jgi:hypothetical protein
VGYTKTDFSRGTGGRARRQRCALTPH